MEQFKVNSLSLKQIINVVIISKNFFMVKTDEILAMKEVLKMIRLINLEMYMRNIYSMKRSWHLL